MAVTDLARTGASALFGAIAKVTGRRSLHPDGVAFAATLVVDEPALGGARLFAAPGRHRAFVRFSRGFGIPEPLPEILSLAVKVPDAYGPGQDQDLLLTASGDRPILRHVFAGGRSHLKRTYSSVLPFSVGGRTMVFGAVPRAAAPRERGEDLDELAAAARAGELALDLRAATPLGPWQTVARLEVGERLGPDEERALAFNSDHAGGGIAPTGVLNKVRGGAYAASARYRPR
jgi:hypothetical protein